MNKYCRYCAKSRVGLLYFFVVFIILNFAARKYIGLAPFTLQELLFIPSVATIFLAICIVILRYLLPHFSITLAKKRDD